MNKILITQHFSRNKGNVSLLYSLVESIKKNIPDSDIIVSSYNPNETTKIFNYNCCEWPFITRNIIEKKGMFMIWNMFKESIIICLQIIVAILVRFKVIKANNLKGRFYFINILSSVDKVVSPGGHLFTNFNQFGAVFAHFYPLFLSSIIKKDYYVLAQTLGPFFGKWRFFAVLLTKYVVKHAKYVSVRDNYSLNNLSSLKIPTSMIHKTNEIVFLYPDESKFEEDNVINDSITVGVTIHHLYYKHFMSKEKYLHETVSFLSKILELGNINIKLISMELNVNDKGDHLFLKEIIQHFPNNENIYIDYISMDPRKVLNTFSKLNYLIATKTHSVVYGLRKSVPTLAIAYNEKTTYFMKDFNLSQYSIPLKDFNANDAFDIFKLLMNNTDNVKETIKMNLANIQKQALENIIILKD
ncbi:MAG: polysaccharide pyruvyl transferase [Bacteroidetes bacterium]|nr:polysaccharide pyruvyl transferase [Bacteroidota bacterium]